MALPNSYTPYSTIQSSYDRISGVGNSIGSMGNVPMPNDPISYSQPINSLRQGRDIINIRTGPSDPASKARVTQQQLDPIRQRYFANYRLTDTQRQNVDRWRTAGGSDTTAWMYKDLSTPFTPTNLRAANEASARINNQQRAYNAAIGFRPTSTLAQSYGRLFNSF